MRHAARLFFVLLLILPSLGCDKATPVAPTGTTLTISASSTKIGLNGSSTITVVGRKPDGNPLNPGTEIRLSTDRGSISPSVVEVDSGGKATATFRGDGRSGAAKITASTADASVDITIQVGESAETKPSLIVSVNPSVIPVKGTSKITVIARNADGSPVASGQQVILTSTLGSIDPSRPTTKGDGTATATLTAGDQSGTAKVSAVLGSSDASTADVEIKDAILTLTADKTSVQEGVATTIRFTAIVTAFQGDAIKGKRVDFRAERGTWQPSSATTDDEGKAVFVLSLPAESVNADVTFQAIASMISGSGTPITATLDITIRNNP